MKKVFLHNNANGEISLSILLGVIILVGVFITGIMSPMKTENGIQGLLVSVTGSSAQNSLSMNGLPFITVTPSPKPTVAPTSASSGSGSGSGTPSITQSVTQSPTQTGGSLLCGTNLHLDDDSDPFLTSAAYRDSLKQLHVASIRIPIRAEGGINPREIQAAKSVKALGMTPVVILKFKQADPAGAAKKVIAEMNTIFGSSPVYYEFGNEVDLAFDVTEQAYTSTWNQALPQIKSLPTNGKFGGPVNYESNPSYIGGFVKNANPKPDFISWHEYTCSSSEAAAACTSDIPRWKVHIAEIKAAIGGTLPPIMITEWNYAPDKGVSGDTKHTDNAFMTDWTTKAIQELSSDGVFASHHYDVESAVPLASSNGTPTAQGKAFSAACAGLK